MKAILIPDNFNHTTNLDALNKSLKDVHTIVKEFTVNNRCDTILIVQDYTRKDKLKKINEISEQG